MSITRQHIICIWCVFDQWHISFECTFWEHFSTLKNVTKPTTGAYRFSNVICKSSHGDGIKKLHVMNQLSWQKSTSGCSSYNSATQQHLKKSRHQLQSGLKKKYRLQKCTKMQEKWKLMFWQGLIGRTNNTKKKWGNQSRKLTGKKNRKREYIANRKPKVQLRSQGSINE